MLPKAFAQRLASKIQYGSPVVKIEQDPKSARVTYLHGGTPQTISADRILCTIPFSVLRDIELKGLSERKIDVINNARYASCLEGLRAKSKPFLGKQRAQRFCLYQNCG